MERRRRYDPELAAAAAALPPEGLIDWDDLPASRAALAAMFGTEDADPAAEPGVAREVRSIPGPAGAPAIQVRVHRPAGAAEPLPGLLWLHGGGRLMRAAGV